MADSDTLTRTEEETSVDVPWNVVVHDDPVNLMAYVTFVLMKIFGYEKKKATILMMQVHQQGRSVVWSGEREKAEFFVQQLQAHQLKTSLKSRMKAMPTLEGGLRIDTEDASDWELLRSVIADATGEGVDLAGRLGGMIGEEAGGEDWEEYVVPDLREAFQDELAQVGASIESAIFEAEGGPGPIWITRDEAFPWYSALNQARLALEEHFHFGPVEEIDQKGLAPVRRAAFVRSKFYCAIQGLLLEYVIK